MNPRALNKRCSILGEQTIGEGADKETKYIPVKTDIPCRIDTNSGKAIKSQVGEVLKRTDLIMMNFIDISESERIEADGRTYKIVFIDNPDGQDKGLYISAVPI